jgi:hypothetical protein
MNKDSKQQHIEAEIEHYFKSSKQLKCPPSMKKNLYQHIADNKTKFSWLPNKLVLASLSLVFVSSVAFKISNNHSIQEESIIQAQAELQVAMHYINRVSFKSLSSVNNNGIKPGLIKPLAKSIARL